MRIWREGCAIVAVLAAAAAVGWASPVFGQQAFTIARPEGQDKQIVIKTRQRPTLLRERISGLGGGGHLGVSIREVTTDDVARLKLAGQSGTVVDEVAADSPAAKAGLVKGDVVVSFDGENVRSAQQFTRLVRETPPGRAVKMAVTRDGKRVDLTVTLDDSDADTFNVRIDDEDVKAEIEREMEGVRPELDRLRERRFRRMPREPMMQPPKANVFRWFDEGPGNRVFGFATGKGRLGVTVQDLTPELAAYFAVTEGVLVSSVAKDTPAAKAGIKAGDVITAVNGTPVDSSGALVDQLREKSGDVTIGLMRDKKAITLKATLENKATPKPRVMTGGTPR